MEDSIGWQAGFEVSVSVCVIVGKGVSVRLGLTLGLDVGCVAIDSVVQLANVSPHKTMAVMKFTRFMGIIIHSLRH